MAVLIKPSEIRRFEITEVYRAPNPKVDIVLVHGLNGNPEKTWTAKNGVFWPNQLLPESLKGAPARILVYGFNADVYAFGNNRSASSDMIHQHAQTLINGLVNERESEDMDDNPIIWVAHSLGGILIKRALNYSYHLSARMADISRSIYIATYGIIFLGTPHTGSDQAKMGIILSNIARVVLPKKVMDTEPQLIRTLKSNNETLQNINLDFLEIFQRFRIDFVHETHKTELVKGVKDFVVDQISASPQLPGVKFYGIEANHSEMCKFESKKAPGYLNVATELRRWANECEPIIQSRFVTERLEHQQARQNAAKESLGIFTPQELLHTLADSRRSSAAPPITPGTSSLKPTGLLAAPQPGRSTLSSFLEVSEVEEKDKENVFELSISGLVPNSIISVSPSKREPYFIKPHGYRPNSIFVGRRKELAAMHTLLTDEKRREEGTSAILIQSLPGGGKSHLARQYVYDHINDYPGGIFWIRAKSQEQLSAGYWEIARKIALNPTTATDASPPKDRAEFISVVVDWMNQNRDWLLVLDGIHFDHSEELRRYIPDAKNTSLIYTSTERSVGGDHHFMNPQVLRLPSLSEREAQELFLLELEEKNPTADELRITRELVQRMGFLPLVIHAVAQRLKATEEPLAKFARDFNAGPKLRDLETYKAVVDQLEKANADEALNLIRIVCFFSQYIPVEMISLGIRALSLPVKTYESISGKSLNNTFKILNRFALLDRSEQSDMNSSQSSRSSREALNDGVDIVKMHSVVQDFFVDSLKADETLPDWLARAVSMFSRSLEEASKRIQAKTNAGLVGDYRSYEIHGTRLLKHVTKHHKRFPSLVESRTTLETCLKNIKSEIVRRTRASSEDIVNGGQPDVFLTSIFDRSSSSSEAGPETPDSFGRSISDHLPWGTDSRLEYSPIHDGDVEHQFNFPAAPVAEDAGYISEIDIRRRAANEQPWTIVDRRRVHKTPYMDMHRTVETQRTKRYHDSLGAWRPVQTCMPPDPRVTQENVAGVFRSGSMTPTPGRPDVSGISQAEVILNQISKGSPPPARGGGIIQDRRRSLQRTPSSRFSGSGGYLSGPRMIPISGPIMYGETSPVRSSISLPDGPESPALEALYGIPYIHRGVYPLSNSATRGTNTPIASQPPYPLSDILTQNEFQQLRSNDPPYWIRSPRTPSHTNYQTFEALPLPYATSSNAPTGRHSVPTRYSDLRSFDTGATNMPPLPASRRPLLRPGMQTFPQTLPGTSMQNPRGYTSQPMSRNTSSPGPALRRSTRPTSIANSSPSPAYALAATAPGSPQQFSFSADPSHFQASENSDPITRRRTPRIGYKRAALVEKAEDWEGATISPPARSQDLNPSKFRPQREPHPSLDPRAEPFTPSRSRTKSLERAEMLRFRNRIYVDQYNDMIMDGGGERMERSGSGGIMIGNRMVAFGDFPESVDFGLARARVEEQRRRIEVRQRDGGGGGAGGRVRRRRGSSPASPVGLNLE